MDIFTVALIVLGLILVQGIGLYFILKRREPETPAASGDGMMLLQKQVQDLASVVDAKLGEGNRSMTESMQAQFAQSQQLVKNIEDRVSSQLLEVTKGVAATNESTRQFLTVADQLSNLERVLKNQKQRGNLGEASLELILSNVLPGQYESQYLFKDGEKVDFVVRTPEGMVPIDAKFPLENYVRLADELDDIRKEQYRKDFKNDVKKRIDETAKYIRPDEGTLPFAFMFIPAEGIYYDLLNNDVGVGVNARDLIDYAYHQKNVIITSPTTFLAYLKTVLFGNQRMKVQEAAKDIIKNVAELGKHLKAYEASHNSMGKSISAAVGHYESSNKAFRAIEKDVVKIADESIELKLESVDRPLLAEEN